MPHTVVTTTAAALPSGRWDGITLQNLSATDAIYFGRKPNLTASGALGGLRLDPSGTATIKESGGTNGPYVIVAGPGTATVAWELYE